MSHGYFNLADWRSLSDETNSGVSTRDFFYTVKKPRRTRISKCSSTVKGGQNDFFERAGTVVSTGGERPL